MTNDNPTNRGESDRPGREFGPEGKGDDHARTQRRGTRVSVDELVAKGRTFVDRVRPTVERVVSTVRSRFGRPASKAHE